MDTVCTPSFCWRGKIEPLTEFSKTRGRGGGGRDLTQPQLLEDGCMERGGGG